MPKKILLIENDQELVGRLTASLEATGFEVRKTGDGKEGLDLARDWSPEAIVLCVELPGMSGYLVCQKLKKDEALKKIPLVLTSAEATEETFEKHRTLKARADDYLLKPYQAPALVQKLGGLIGLPEVAAAVPAAEEAEEELVSLEEELGMGAAEGELGVEVAGLELESLPDEPAAAGDAAAVDEDLRLLDDAFDGLAAPAAGAQEAAAALDQLTGEKPMAGDEVDAAAASLPEEDESAGRAALGALDTDADAALGALGGIDETLSPGLPLRSAERPAPAPERAEVPAPAVRAPRGASADLLRAAGIRLLEEEPAPAPPPPRGAALIPPPPEPVLEARGGAAAEELTRLKGELEEARAALAHARDDLASRDGELRDLRRKVETAGRRADDADAALADAKALADAAQERARKAEADLKASADEARRAADEGRRAADEARALGDQLAEEKRRGDEVAHRADELERRGAELERRSAELEERATAAEKRAADAEVKVEDLETRAAAAEEDARRKGEEAAAAEEAIGRAEALEHEAEGLRTELLVARGEAEGARGEIEKRSAELKKRISELEAANAKNEERVVKAYQKIKADEKVRDKVRKALAIAAQLLEDGLPAEGEKRPGPAREERP